MEIREARIKGLFVIEPKVFADDRGYFFESYSEAAFRRMGIDVAFKQDNQSLSRAGVVRGLHFQAPPFEQGKLVRVAAGAVLDVAVDIRKGSPTYGEHVAIELTEENKRMFYIPPGFAHGFAALRDNTVFSYKCTNAYDKASEGSLLWSDPGLGIDWRVESPLLSEKDMLAPRLIDLESPFDIGDF